MKRNVLSVLTALLAILVATASFAQEVQQKSAGSAGQKSLTVEKPKRVMASQELPAKMSPDEKPVEISNEFREEILQLLDLLGTGGMAERYQESFSRVMITQLMRRDREFPEKEFDSVKDETKKVISEKLPELTKKMVDVYARHYTREDVKQIAAFYKTPIGMKVIKETPLISKESMAIGNNWGKELLPILQARVEERLKKNGYKAPEQKNAPPQPALKGNPSAPAARTEPGSTTVQVEEPKKK